MKEAETEGDVVSLQKGMGDRNRGQEQKRQKQCAFAGDAGSCL